MIKFIFFIAVLIIVLLSVVALYFTFKVANLRKKQRKQIASTALEQVKRRAEVNTSIQVLAGAVGRDELTLTEASIRIASLLDSLNVTEGVKSSYAGFYQLREATSHMPILKAWQALSARQKQQYTLERARYESMYGDFVIDAAKRIQGVTF